MSTEFDHRLAGEFVRHFQQYGFTTVAAFTRAVKADRSTVYRMFDGAPGTRAALLRRTELALELPDYGLDMIKQHDLDGLRAAGANERHLAWLAEQLKDQQPDYEAGRGRNALGE